MKEWLSKGLGGHSGWRSETKEVVGLRIRYLRAEGLQLGGSHTDQLHSILIVGDGARQVGHLNTKKITLVRHSMAV